MRKVDLTGQRFGKLVVVKELPKELDEYGKSKGVRWLCQCDCGNTCITNNACLKGGKHSCGCTAVEIKEKQRQQLAAAREARLAKWGVFEKEHRCPFPDAGCTKSKRGVCCWDCDQYEACEAKGRVCKNSPAKCGVRK